MITKHLSKPSKQQMASSVKTYSFSTIISKTALKCTGTCTTSKFLVSLKCFIISCNINSKSNFGSHFNSHFKWETKCIKQSKCRLTTNFSFFLEIRVSHLHKLIFTPYSINYLFKFLSTRFDSF